MNIRQQKYKKNRIAGMNMYNAARTAGYSHSMAIHAGVKLEKKITSLNDYLEQAGLTDKRLSEFLTEVLEANKVVGYLHQYKKGEKGRIEELSSDETISNEFLEVPDFNIRLKAAELVLKIKGQLTDRVKVEGGGTNIHIYPSKTLIFQDIKETNVTNNGTADNLHAKEGATGNRLTGKV